MRSLVVHKTIVFVQFEFVHEPLFGSNVARVHVLFARLGGFAFRCFRSDRKMVIGPSQNLEVSRVAAMTLPNPLSSHHGWMICKISTAIEA